MKNSIQHTFTLMGATCALTLLTAFSSEVKADFNYSDMGEGSPIILAANAATDPYLVKEFTLSGPGKLEVETSGGSIKVEGHDSNQVRVEMHLHKDGKTYAAGDSKGKELLEDFTIDISQSGNSISAKAEKNSSGWFSFGDSPSISFTVHVPRNMSSKLHTSGGSIQLEGVKGPQDVKTSGGSLKLKNISGDMNAYTSGGSITLTDYRGTVEAKTSGGSIKLANASGNLKVHTSGGSISIENVKGSLDASTSGGSIKANLLGLDRYVKLHTSGGSISASLPKGAGLDLDLKGNKVNTQLQNFNGEVEKNRVKGSMNGGGIQVVMSTSGGNVNVEYQ